MTATDRKWIPSEWLDELNPMMLDSPDAYIEVIGNGWGLRLPEGDDDRENPFYQSAVEPGQVVNFLWTDNFGQVVLTVRHNGSWSTDYSTPEGATHFYEHSTGAITDSIAELVNGDPESHLDPLPPGDYVVDCYTWSEDIPLRFDVGPDGVARFSPCAGAN